MRRMRGTALAAAAMAGVLTLAGCAKDSGGGNSSNNTAASTGGSDCVTAQKPPAAPAAASSSTAAGAKVDGSKLKIGLAFDVGGRGDASFNDAAAAGTDKAKSDLGVTTVSESTASASEAESAKQQRLDQMASSGLNPIIAVGFAYAPSVKVVAAKYPNTKFAIVDDDSITLPNVTPLVFAEEQGSFLVGAAAALKTTACKIGFVGGVETPLIKKFEAGYIAGAKAVAPNIQVDSKYLTPAGDFTGFNDPAKATEVARGELDGGADIIYHASGASGKGVFEAVAGANTAQSPKWAIGVDSDQAKTATPPTNERILTSMLKRVDVAVFDYINASAAGNLTTLPKVFDLKVDGVGYATTGGHVADIAPQLDAYKAAIIGGQISVPTSP